MLILIVILYDLYLKQKNSQVRRYWKTCDFHGGFANAAFFVNPAMLMALHVFDLHLYFKYFGDRWLTVKEYLFWLK